MANRNFTQFSYSLEKKLVTIFATVDFNAASAPAVKKFTVPAAGGAGSYATTTSPWKGVTGVARTAQGKYTFTFEDKYVRLLGIDYTFYAIDGTTSPLALNMFVLSDTLNTSKTLVLGATSSANSATLTDLGANDRVLFAFTFSDSTAV